MGIDPQRQLDDLLEELGFGYWKAAEYQSLEPGQWELFIHRYDGHIVRVSTLLHNMTFRVDGEVFRSEKLKGCIHGLEGPYKAGLARGLRALDEHFGVCRSRLELLLGS